MSLPPHVQVRLSRRPPVVIDGETLHPNMQLLLTVTRQAGKRRTLSHEDVRVARARMARSTTRFARAVPPVAAVHDVTIMGPGGPLAARHYAPPSASPEPLLVYLHGGGFALGDLDTHDHPCRALCQLARIHVLSVAYRLAPEHPYPAAVDDAFAALRYAQANAGSFGADPARVAIGGDSAGGNLATVIAQRTRDDHPPCAQLLLYPTVDIAGDWPSRHLFGRGFYLTSADMDLFNGWYLGAAQRELLQHPELSPLRAADHSGLCPALLVTCGFDPLRDEGEAYARKLDTAGTKVTTWREPGLLHGFVHMAAVSPVADAALARVATEFARVVRG